MIVKTNLPEFKSKLNQIKLDLQRKVVGRAASAAGGAMREVARKEAPERPLMRIKFVPGTRQNIPPGLLKRAMMVYRQRSKPGTVMVGVMPRMGRRARKGKGSSYLRDAYYAPWVEFGHIARGPGQRIRGGARRKRLELQRLLSGSSFVPPNPFMQRAFRKGQRAAIDAFYKQLEKAFLKYRAL